VLGLGIALVINGFAAGSITRAVLMAVMLIPWAIPTAVSSRMWQFMFGSTRTGFFNTVLWYLGLGDGNIPFLTDPRFQMPAMITIDVWKTTSFMALLLLAGLQLIPGDLYEAASVDGASKWKQFWRMTLPMLRPTIAVALVFRTLDALRVFDVFQIVLAQARYSMASFTYYELINNGLRALVASSVVIFC
jgi:trehalose/maltose transport system permease protein